MIVMPVMTAKPVPLKLMPSRMNPKKLSPQRLLKPVVMRNVIIMEHGAVQDVPVMTTGAGAIVPRITGMIVVSMDRMSAAHTVSAIPAGAAAIARKRRRQPVAGMEHGAGHSVPVIPAGAGTIVHKIHERLATIMEHGVGQVVTVIRVGAGVIVPNAVGMDIGHII